MHGVERENSGAMHRYKKTALTSVGKKIQPYLSASLVCDVDDTNNVPTEAESHKRQDQLKLHQDGALQDTVCPDACSEANDLP
jgi:hypothetical protein